VEEAEVILENLGCAEFVLEKWLMKEKFLDLPSPVGKRRIYVGSY